MRVTIRVEGRYWCSSLISRLILFLINGQDTKGDVLVKFIGVPHA